MKVTNKPRVNEIISDATMIKQLHNQIKALKVELDKAKNETNVSYCFQTVIIVGQKHNNNNNFP